MDPKLKVAHQRLSVLQLAEILGNVSEACRQRGMTRAQFYEYKRRFQTHGIEGLKDLPSDLQVASQDHSARDPEEHRRLELGVPELGLHWLSDALKVQGVSGPTIQNILNKNGLTTTHDRLLRLEEKSSEKAITLTAEQVALIEKADHPCFRERHVESSRPGELLAQDTFFVGQLKGVGKVYMQAVVDTYGS